MSVPFVGEIRIFSGGYAPQDWTFCDGGMLSIAQFTELYSVIGTVYGGDENRTQFAVPDLRGTAPLHPGKRPGSNFYQQGQRVGAAEVTLTVDEMGAHQHSVHGVEAPPSSNSPDNNYIARAVDRNDNRFQSSSANLVPFDGIDFAGTGNAHNNMQPYLALRYMIALKGNYPPHG